MDGMAQKPRRTAMRWNDGKCVTDNGAYYLDKEHDRDGAMWVRMNLLYWSPSVAPTVLPTTRRVGFHPGKAPTGVLVSAGYACNGVTFAALKKVAARLDRELASGSVERTIEAVEDWGSQAPEGGQ